MRVLAAMSGGVDSAVAAARAVEAGHDVTGVHLALARNPQTYRTGARGCCTLEDARDARRAADVIGIPFYVWDMADQFHADVVDDFVAEYAAGRTPNPCLRCNEKIKFAAVLDRAIALGFDAVVTGHHARLGPDGLLRRSVDAGQGPVVRAGGADPRAAGPLDVPARRHRPRPRSAPRPPGAAWPWPTSPTRTTSASSPTATPAASSPSGSARRPATSSTPPPARWSAATPARTRTRSGSARGCTWSGPPPDGRPRYVLSITPVTNTVTVGPAEALEVSHVAALRPVWTAGPAPGGPIECEVQLRAHGDVVPATVVVDGDRLTAELRRPVRGVAAGQAIVAYRPDPAGDIVLGSATISR